MTEKPFRDFSENLEFFLRVQVMKGFHHGGSPSGVAVSVRGDEKRDAVFVEIRHCTIERATFAEQTRPFSSVTASRSTEYITARGWEIAPAFTIHYSELHAPCSLLNSVRGDGGFVQNSIPFHRDFFHHARNEEGRTP